MVLVRLLDGFEGWSFFINIRFYFFFLCVSGERDGVEMITAGVSRLSRDQDRTSTGSTQSTGDWRCSLFVLIWRELCFFSVN